MGNTYCVYKHTAPNGKVYIGQTKQKPSSRFSNGNGYKECPIFYSAIKKYGWDAFTHEILATGLSAKEASEKERELISQYRSDQKKYGYNATSGGQAEFQLNEEARLRRSLATKRNWENPAYRAKITQAMTGSNNHMYGKKMSKESCMKMSIAAKARKHMPMSDEAKAKLSETRKKQGNFRTGKHHTEEAKEKIRRANLGKKVVVSEETKKKISESLKGIKRSDATRERMSQAQKIAMQKRTKKVIQLDPDSKQEIRTYNSVIEAARGVGAKASTLICECCKKKVKTAYGYQWEYAT